MDTEEGEPRQGHRQTHWSFCPLSSQAHLCLLSRAARDPHLCQEHQWIPPAAHARFRGIDFENLSCPKITTYLYFILQPLNRE